jgi:hypothetical protein
MASGKKVRFIDEIDESEPTHYSSLISGSSVYDRKYLVADEPAHERRGPPDFSRQSSRVRWNLSALIASFLHDEAPEDISGVLDGTIIVDWNPQSLEHLDKKLFSWVKHKVPGDAIGVFLIYILYDLDPHIDKMLTQMVDEGYSRFDIAWNVTFVHCGEEVAAQLITYDGTDVSEPPMGRVEEEPKLETESQGEILTHVNELPSVSVDTRSPFLNTDEPTHDKADELLKQGDTLSEQEIHSKHYEISERPSTSDDLDDLPHVQLAKAQEQKPQVNRLPSLKRFKAKLAQVNDLFHASSSKQPLESISGSFSFR